MYLAVVLEKNSVDTNGEFVLVPVRGVMGKMISNSNKLIGTDGFGYRMISDSSFYTSNDKYCVSDISDLKYNDDILPTDEEKLSNDYFNDFKNKVYIVKHNAKDNIVTFNCLNVEEYQDLVETRNKEEDEEIFNEEETVNDPTSSILEHFDEMFTDFNDLLDFEDEEEEECKFKAIEIFRNVFNYYSNKTTLTTSNIMFKELDIESQKDILTSMQQMLNMLNNTWPDIQFLVDVFYDSEFHVYIKKVIVGKNLNVRVWAKPLPPHDSKKLVK